MSYGPCTCNTPVREVDRPVCARCGGDLGPKVGVNREWLAEMKTAAEKAVAAGTQEALDEFWNEYEDEAEGAIELAASLRA